MKKYNDFLFERKWEGTKILDEKGFWKLFNENCSDFDPEIFITKFMSTFHDNDFFMIDKLKRERRSVNTEFGNYYTLLINHLDAWKDYPMREQICELNGYWSTGEKYVDYNYVVIPLNGSKWGVVPKGDIWYVEFNDTELAHFYKSFKLSSTKEHGIRFKISDHNWEEFVDDIEIANNKFLSKFSRKFKVKLEDMKDKYNGDILEFLNKEFTPKKLGFSVVDYKNLKDFIEYPYLVNQNLVNQNNEYTREVWTQSPCLYVKNNLYFKYILPKINETNVI